MKAPEIVTGPDGQIAAAVAPGADTVVTGVVGVAGLLPTIEAIKLGRTIALANKETLISGGPVILPLLKKHGAVMTPADSEHSAIFQCLQGVPPDSLRRVILTASGGAFRDFTAEELFALNKAEPETVRKKATTHPNWDMGAKITVDSATMMNKGLEVIEARDEPLDRHRPCLPRLSSTHTPLAFLLTHPTHHRRTTSSASTTTTSTSSSTRSRSSTRAWRPPTPQCICQLGWPDMRLPILYSDELAAPDQGRLRARHRREVRPGAALADDLQGTRHGQVPVHPARLRGGAQGRLDDLRPQRRQRAGQRALPRGRVRLLRHPQGDRAASWHAHENDFKADPTLEDILEADAWARKMVSEESARVSKGGILL